MIELSLFEPIWLTLKLALVSTLVLLVIGIPFAWWLAQRRGWLIDTLNTLVALPLVLPPTVIGFYLLLVMSPESPIGRWLDTQFGLILPFSFTGLVIGSVIYSLPFVIQPIRNAFVAIGHEPLETAATLRAHPLDAFISVALPLAKPGILTGAVLGFAHTLGEFGVVLLIGGNIPGETRVVSIAIYDQVETLEWANAHWLSASMLLISFALLLIMQRLQRNSQGML
jgi:molybdate transport system permease protein